MPQPRTGRILLHLACAPVLVFLVLPLAIVFPISFSSSSYLQFPPPGWSLQWYQAFLESPAWLEATARSFFIAAVVAAAATAIGAGAAFSLVRGSYPGRRLVGQLVMVPMTLPSIVYAVAAYGLFSGFQLVGTWYGLAFAHVIHALPLVVLIVGASFRTLDPALEQAAQGLGASWFGAVRMVTLPQIRPALVSAALVAFISSFDEVVVAVFLGGVRPTLPKKMFDSLIFEIDPTIAAVSVLQIAVVVLAMLLAARFGSGLDRNA